MINREEKRKFVIGGITAFLVIACSIIFYFCIHRFSGLASLFNKITTSIAPITYGLIIAYLVTPIYNFLYRQTKKMGGSNGISRLVSTALTLAFTIAVLTLITLMVLPQVIQSIRGIIENIPGYIQNLSNQVVAFSNKHPEFEEIYLAWYNSAAHYLEDLFETYLVPSIQSFIFSASNGVLTLLSMIKNLVIGLIVSVYVLNSKDLFAAQSKKILYGCLSEKWTKIVLNEVQFAHSAFGGFIRGKLVDSLIIGILCFFCVNLLKMPYPMLLSVIVGVTNVIPFFGPFIGAIPCILLIFLVSPLKSLYFLIFIFLLQQLDGNIIGPKILGDSIGVNSFWILFSILLFGGLFGFLGMLIGVPVFAIIYHLISDLICFSLRKKQLPTETKNYYTNTK
ncbi:MAG: AI-2E family transporter [Clostridiales bacterium]|nr:AI-2E family transporter [Clostridiales bacterium]